MQLLKGLFIISSKHILQSSILSKSFDSDSDSISEYKFNLLVKISEKLGSIVNIFEFSLKLSNIDFCLATLPIMSINVYKLYYVV